MAPHLLAVNYLDQLDSLFAHAITTGKAAGAATAIAFILVAYTLRRTLGAVLAAGVVAGLVLYAINNTDALEKNTKDTFAGQQQGLPALVVGSNGIGAGGGGGGAI